MWLSAAALIVFCRVSHVCSMVSVGWCSRFSVYCCSESDCVKDSQSACLYWYCGVFVGMSIGLLERCRVMGM